MSNTRLYGLKVETMEGERPVIRLGTVRSQTAYRNQFEICYSGLKDCTGLTRAALIARTRGHHVPRRATKPSEIERRKALPKGTLLAEEQVRGIAVGR